MAEEVKCCLDCQDYLSCLKLQLDYARRREFNRSNDVDNAPESFFKFMAEKCGSFALSSSGSS